MRESCEKGRGWVGLGSHVFLVLFVVEHTGGGRGWYGGFDGIVKRAGFLGFMGCGGNSIGEGKEWSMRVRTLWKLCEGFIDFVCRIGCE